MLFVSYRLAVALCHRLFFAREKWPRCPALNIQGSVALSEKVFAAVNNPSAEG